MYLSKLKHEFVKVATWICNMDASKLSHVFPALRHQDNLKFDQDLKDCWSFISENKV